MIKDNWISTKKELPKKGTLCTIKVRRGGCTCDGYKIMNSYFEESFYGITYQSKIDYWKSPPSPEL